MTHNQPKETTMTTSFDHILSWELKEGSHEFPGPNGGTCINEAAIVAAGFEYRAIRSANDCPPCFSRPIAAYALALNDRMPDAVRNELLTPFVTRLAGTADTPEIEQARIEFIVIQTVRRILPPVLRRVELIREAEACERAETFGEARAATTAATTAATAADIRAAYAAATAAAHATANADAWPIAVEILDGAIRMGNQGDHLAVEVAIERMNRAREAVTA